MLGRRKDVPLILQNSNAECGAACLAMVLGYHGRKTAISELHDCISTGRDGVRASALSRAAREKGLRTRSFSGEPEHFPVLPLPAIVHWEFKHYIVVERWSPTEVTVVDPAMGRRTLTSEEFDAGFTGIIMIFEPGVDFERKRPTRDDNPWRVYLDYMLSLSGIRRILLQILGASLLLQLLGLAVPIATKVIVDDILPFKLESLLGIMALGLGVIVVMLAVTTFLRHALFIYLQTRLDSQMMLGFFEHLLNL
ncbi:MAG: cysteine peptidase family C39 domain-containing protein, partial [Acidobacteriota bacterium]